eukprot:9407824-Pyramimonas_sp.AAC.1
MAGTSRSAAPRSRRLVSTPIQRFTRSRSAVSGTSLLPAGMPPPSSRRELARARPSTAGQG